MSKKTFKEAFGKNPWDPWSAKAGLDETSEAQLQKYLLSRGINPKYVTKDIKIAHSKSNQFKQWASVHQEDVDLDEDHIAIAMGKMLDDEGSMILNQLDILEDSIAKLRTVVKDPKMQLPAWVQSKVTLATDYVQTVADYMASDNEKEMKEAANPAQQAAIAINMKKKGIKPKNEIASNVESEFREEKVKPIKINIKTPTPTAAERLYQKHQAIRKASGLPDPAEYKKKLDSMKSEETISEGDPCWQGYTQVGTKDKGGRKVPNCVPEAKGYKDESVLYDDPKGTLTRVTEKKKQMSRSAKIVKSIYKKKDVMKEDTYDWEKSNKDDSSYGKKPKMSKVSDKEEKSEKESAAAATLSGGTTLTKQPRDTIELDPKMKTKANKDANERDDNHRN